MSEDTESLTHAWLKVENKTLFDENILKVPVWASQQSWNKTNNLQIFQSFAFQAK